MQEAATRPPIPELKLRPPARPRDVVPRPRLFDRLDDATRRRCTLLAAGPGYGKSVLLASWVEQQDQFDRVAWLSLDASDASPQRFVAHLVAALQEPFGAAADPPQALLQIRPPPPSAVPEFFEEALLPALDELAEPLLLVLDDAHHLGYPAAIAGLDLLLRWAPPTLRLVISGRYDPPLALQRLRLAGELSTLRQDQLACTLDESRALLSTSLPQLSAEHTAAVHDLTQGWPAALRLAALALQDLATAPAFLERFLNGDDALADYLMSEVLMGLTPQLRSFVLQATVDPVVCGDLVDEVCGTADGEPLLRECERRNLFLTRVPHEHRDWYAWHHMFADQMQRRLQVEDPAGAREAHLAAARWWRPTDPERSVRHASAAGDSTLAGSILAEAWLGMALAGDSRTLLDLLSLLAPQEHDLPELRLAACYAELLESDQPSAMADLRLAVAGRPSVPEERRWWFDARAAWLRLLLTDHPTALAEVLSEARVVLRQAPSRAIFDEADPTYALAVLAVGMCEARLQADVPAAIGLLRGAVDAGKRNGHEILELVARAELCIPRILEGDLLAIEHEASALVQEAERRGWQSFGPMSQPISYLAWLAFWRGDMATARRHVARAAEICPPTDWHLGQILYFHGRVALADGDTTTAQRDLERARTLAENGCMHASAESLLLGLEAEIAAAAGDLAAAMDVLAGGPRPEHRMTTLSRAALLRRTGDPEGALATLDELADPFPHVAVVRGLIRSLSLHALEEVEACHDALESALDAAEPAGLVGPFLAEATEIGPLLDAHMQRGTDHERFATVLANRLAGVVEQQATGRHERLTERELIVLRYLRTSMPNAEIAAQLYLSVNTVKTHAASVYRKLGVGGRRDAVHRAHELGLFGYAAAETGRADASSASQSAVDL